MRTAGAEPFPIIYVDSNETDGNFEPASKSQLKKIQKIWTRENYKAADKSKKEVEDAEKRQKNFEEAKKIVITEDKSLPEAKRVKICDCREYRDQRVVIFGWAHRIRRQGKALMFITLRDGSGFLQCVLADKLCQTYNAVLLSTESSIKLVGTLITVPEGKTVSHPFAYYIKFVLKIFFVFIFRLLVVMNSMWIIGN